MKKNSMLSLFLFFILCCSLLLSPIHSKGATFIVDSLKDAGAGSLRAAITAANANGIPDTIVFNIAGSGVQTISPQSPLPRLTDGAGVFIDGLTQSGASIGANPPATLNLMIEISGGGAGLASGIFIDCDNNRIQGLIINNFYNDGISIEAGAVVNTSNNEIYWNIIGLDPTGTVLQGNCINPVGLWAGVRIFNIAGDPPGTSIATNNYVVENLISGNAPSGDGVQIMGPQLPGDVFGNFVLRNYIGTDITGAIDLGNAHEGVCLCEGTHDNLVDSNLVSGNDYDGVGMQGYNNEPFPPAPPIQTRSNKVTNNIIGLAIDAVSPLPNSCHGVAIGEYGPGQWGCADYNTVGPGNIIAYNGWAGVSVWEDAINNFNADGNLITQNSIHNNTALGIDLQNNGVTSNDPSDPDTGPNQELNFPVINSAVYQSGSTTISGSIDIDTDPTQATIEIFKANPDPSGYGEGETYLGSATPDGAGNWSTIVTGLIPGDYVTATTTDLNQNTSEFSSNYMIDYMTVTSPNGGESWQVGSSHNITWTSNGTSGNVQIEYSTDNGSSWTVEIASTTDNGSYSWTIPDDPSDSCLVRVSDTDGSPWDVSDAVFTIWAPTITVTSPNGGEDWEVDSTYDITWTSNGTSGSVQIEYLINNGSVWSDVIAITTDDGTHPWTIPNTPSDSCLVRVSDTAGSPSDESDAMFTISVPSSVPLDGLPEIYSMRVRRMAASNKFEVIYAVPKRASIKLGVYDVIGTKIEEISEESAAGFYSREIDMSGKPAGAYFIRIEANGNEFSKTHKILLVR